LLEIISIPIHENETAGLPDSLWADHRTKFVRRQMPRRLCDASISIAGQLPPILSCDELGGSALREKKARWT